MLANVERKGDIARIILSGNLDFSTQGNLMDAMDQALGMADAREIQVDMTNATFIDSAVIRALLNLQERATGIGKSLSLWNCNEHIRGIFGIGGFDQMFTIH